MTNGEVRMTKARGVFPPGMPCGDGIADAACWKVPGLALPAGAVGDPAQAAAFAEAVRGELEGTILRYSRRQRLLRRARAMGMNRFEANLIMAAVLHQVPAPVETASASAPVGRIWPWVAAALAAEAAGLVLAWWLMVG